MKTSALVALGLFIVWTLLSIVQLWGNVLESTIYWKITITIGMVAIAVVSGGLIYREYVEEEKMKKEGYID